MPDRWVVALAGAATLGALRPSELPLLVGIALTLGALAARRPALLCLGVAVLTSSLGGRALDGLHGLEAAPAVGEMTLVTDPEPAYGGIRATARLDGRRLEVIAAGPAAAALGPRLAGERVRVRGEVVPLDLDDWTGARHLAGRLRVHVVEGWRPGPPVMQLANVLRRTLVEGAAPLDAAERSLFTGLVIGDDRHQPVPMADDFLGAGLTHLLAVSGQNVAFVLLLAGPALRRLRIWPRCVLTLAVVGLFGLLTRFEPSVLRAASMAAVAVTIGTAGAAVSRLRVLGLTVTGLLLIDPLLARSMGFRLSVAATGAILLFAAGIAEGLPGPLVVRSALSVTIAAQLGVAPVLLAAFGPIPVASLPANLLAVPAAGLVMMWGLTGGLLAGVVPGAAPLAHVPTRLALGWLAEVATRCAHLPLGTLGWPHLAGLAIGLALARHAAARPRPAGGPGPRGPDRASEVADRLRAPAVRRVGLAVAAGSILAAVVAAQAPPPLRAQLGPGVVRWHAGETDVIVLGGAGGGRPPATASVLAALRTAGVRSIAVLVLAEPSSTSTAVHAIEARHPTRVVVVAPGAEPRDVVARAPVLVAPRSALAVTVGALEVRLTALPDRLVVDARPAGAAEPA
ncbi:MAG: ComEC/Rec2 family competence protein [Acidimicrobiales bacterium]